MFNLRQLNSLDHAVSTNYSSRFTSPNFRVPSGFLGNIGEPLDYSQSEPYIYRSDGDIVRSGPPSVSDTLSNPEAYNDHNERMLTALNNDGESAN